MRHRVARDHRGRPVPPWMNCAIMAMLRAAVAAGSFRLGMALVLLVYDRLFRWCVIAAALLLLISVAGAYRHTVG